MAQKESWKKSTRQFLFDLERFGVHFFGKNPNPDSESKNGFFCFFGKIQKTIMNPMNPL